MIVIAALLTVVVDRFVLLRALVHRVARKIEKENKTPFEPGEPPTEPQEWPERKPD